MRNPFIGRARRTGSLAIFCALLPAAAHAQFSFDNGAVQVHSFFSEGYAKSNDNNFLTMHTSGAGDARMAQGAVNVTWNALDNLRFSAQAYDHYIGDLGEGQVMLDFALADYKVKDWLGFRGGKVKTPLGLYNDTQDMTFLYTFALLPQGVYPMDLRSMTIAHVGGDIYGNIEMPFKAGSVSYQVYAGQIPDDPRGGYTYGIEDEGVKMNGGIHGRTEGVDVRWTTPIKGVMIGSSFANNERDFKGYLKQVIPASYATTMDHVFAEYAEYKVGRFSFDGEYRRTLRDALVPVPALRATVVDDSDETAWFIAGSYRLTRRIDVGSYYSWYTFSVFQKPVITAPRTGPGANYIHDPVISARIKLTKWWDAKVEGHFMNGIGGVTAHGFYPQSNPGGMLPQTNMLVLMSEWNL